MSFSLYSERGVDLTPTCGYRNIEKKLGGDI